MWSRAADIKARARGRCSLGGCGDAQAESRPPWVETRKEARACLPACLPACWGAARRGRVSQRGQGGPWGRRRIMTTQGQLSSILSLRACPGTRTSSGFQNLLREAVVSPPDKVFRNQVHLPMALGPCVQSCSHQLPEGHAEWKRLTRVLLCFSQDEILVQEMMESNRSSVFDAQKPLPTFPTRTTSTTLTTTPTKKKSKYTLFQALIACVPGGLWCVCTVSSWQHL